MKKVICWIGRIMIVLEVFFIIIILFLIAKYDYETGFRFPTREFVNNGKNEPYSQNIPLHEMDFEVYSEYFTDLVAFEDTDFDHTVVLPCDVCYYARKEDEEPILILTKGTEVRVWLDVKPTDRVGYGLKCWPDYDEKWHYGCLFITENDPNYSVKEKQKYYVKTKELEKVAKAYYKENWETEWRFTTPWDAAEKITQDLDRQLYMLGVFCPERWK